MEHYYALIMAGGGGTRLWPMSRKERPKQFLPLVEDRTLYKMTVDRLKPLLPPECIFIVTGENYVNFMRKDTPEIPPENFIIEPHARDNAPAAALAISVIFKRDPEATVALLAADHHIAREEDFRGLLCIAHDIAQDDYIVTLGISPTFPATNFGYIRQGEPLREVDGRICYQSLEFTEKPDVVTATGFLASGKYSWNSGMFVWTARRAMAELERQQPEMYALLQELEPAIDTPDYQQKLLSIWDRMPRTTIDFAVMEGADRMAVIPADIGWSDVGSWDTLFNVLELDKFGNGFKDDSPDHVILDTKNSLIYSGRLAVTIGVEDLIVVDTDDVILICHKDRTQDVRDVVQHLRATKKDQYL